MRHDHRLERLPYRSGDLEQASEVLSVGIYQEGHNETHLSPLVLFTSLLPAQGATPTSTTTVARSCPTFPPALCFGSRGPKTHADIEVKPCVTVEEPSAEGCVDS